MNKLIAYSKNLSVYFGASIVPMAISLFTNPWIAMNMSPKDYAISGYYLSFSSLINPIIVFYLIHYYIKEYFRKSNEDKQKLFAIIAKALIWFSGLVALLCFGLLYIYLKYCNSTLSFQIMPYLALMVFALPLTGLYSLQQAKYRMEKKAKSFFRLSLLNCLVSTVMILLFVVYFKWGAFGKLLAPLIGNFIIFGYLAMRFVDIWRIKTTFAEFRPIFIFCLPLALSAMLGYFTNGFSTTYIENIGNTTEYGIYIVGNSIASYLAVFSTAFNNTFQPDLYENIAKKQWHKYIKICLIQILLVTIVVFVFIVFAPYIISILTAGIYVASIPYAQIIAISSLTASIYFIINNFSIATDRPKLYLYTSIFGSIIIVVSMPYVIANWSFYGGAWMNVISFVIFTIINIILLLITKQKPNKNAIS